jgi:hypothetical protein
MSRKKKTPEPWVPGLSEMSDKEMEKLPPESMAKLLCAVEACEKRDRGQLIRSYSAALSEAGVPADAIAAVTKEKDIDRLYVELAPTHLHEISLPERLRMKKALLRAVARACRTWRSNQIGRRQQANKQVAETEAKVRSAQMLARERSPGASISNIDLDAAEIACVSHRTAERRKTPR